MHRYRPLLFLLITCCLMLGGPLVRAAAWDAPLVTAAAVRDGVSLSGQWRFQPGDDPAWAAADLDDSSWQAVTMPGRWPQGGYPETGQLGWYRLSLQLAPELRNRETYAKLAVRLGRVLNAYELYAGGELVGGVGSLPPLTRIDYDRERVLPLPPSAVTDDGRLVLALRVWGGEQVAVDAWGAGPTRGEYRLGEYQPLLLAGFLGQLPGLLSCAIIIVFGFYHLYVYTRNRELSTYLWFGLMAINIGIYGLMLTQWKYATDLSFPAMKKIEFGAIYLFPALGIQTVWAMLGLRIGPVLRGYQWTFVAASLAVVAIPGHRIHFQTLTYWQFWVIPAMLLAGWTILREARLGNSEARTGMLGMLLFLLTCVNDLLIDLAYLDSARMLHLGFLAITVSMSVSMANRFSTMYNTLESEVEERTTALREANERLAEAARVDHLTGLLNRRGFLEDAEQEMVRAHRSGKEFSLVLADIDYFKQFNDDFGHACGDHVLKRVAALLREGSREIDGVARWGGEEFILLLPETDADGAAVLARKLRDTISGSLYEFAGKRLTITMTFGVAAHRKGETLDTCVARADTALYHGKERGRNKVMIGKYRGLTLVN